MNGRKRLSWEETAMNLAFKIAEYRSEDLHTQVGCCIIKKDNSIILGYNGAPSGQEIDWENREEKRKRVRHAEVNALDNVKAGEVKIFCVTHFPCLQCINAIANKLVNKVYYGMILPNYDPDEVFKIAKEYKIDMIQA